MDIFDNDLTDEQKEQIKRDNEEESEQWTKKILGNNYKGNDEELDLDLGEKLESEGIVQKFVKDKKRNSIKIELNHKYKQTKIIIPINKNDWIKFHESADKILKYKGITDQKDIQLIGDAFDNNYESIIGEKGEGEEQEERKSLAQILVELVLENHIKLLKDEFNVPHIVVMINDHYQTLPIDSTKFKRYLSQLYYDAYDRKIANTESINNAVSQLEAKATFEGQTIPLHLRVAWSSNPANSTDTIYYDLSDNKNSCIKITKDGFKVVDNQIEVLFRRYNHLKPQVIPIIKTTVLDDTDSIDSKKFDEFISLFNLKTNTNDTKLLLKCYIISLFIPEIPKPILLLHGEQGGAKSTFQELVKMLVDPSGTQTLTFPRDSTEFIQQLSHNYIAYYDNVSVIQDWISDLLCRAVTGSSFSKRALWTNDDDFYYNFKRIIGINGIDLAATKADLLDRSIIIQTERIDKKDRKKITEIWEEFNQLKPYVLGYIFDILAKVLRYKEEHGEIDFPNGLNRMADWEEYGEIISRCMDNKDGEFQRVYAENIGIQVDEAIESSPLSQAIIEFMNQEIVTIERDPLTGQQIKKPIEEWTGTPTKLYTELQNIAIGKLNLNVSRSKLWPKSASHLTRKINGIKTNLREKGIEIKTGDKDSKDRRLITINKVSSMPSMPSKPDNSSTNQGEKVDGTEKNDKVPSKVPSTNNEANQTQNTDSRQHDSIDGTLPTDNKKNNDMDFLTINHLNRVAETEKEEEPTRESGGV